MSPRPPQAEYTIRDLAEAFGVTARALRFYEAKGLLRPRRRGQARLYSANDRARLNLILRGKRVGFTLDEIAEMLDVEGLGEGGRTAMSAAAARFRARVLQLRAQRADIEHALRDLEAGLAWLEARLARVEPDADIKTRAAAFEALARTWLYGDAAGAAGS